MDLSIVIVNWNTRDLLAKCLGSVYVNPPACAFDVWVVDNASTDGSAAMVRDTFPQAQLIENQSNVGFACANNQVLIQVQSTFVVLLNSDTEVEVGALQFLIEAIEGRPNVGAVGPKMLNPDGTWQNSYGTLPSVWTEILGPYNLDFISKPWGKFGRFTHKRKLATLECLTVDRVSFACTLIRNEAFEGIGLLDERFDFYSEDYDFFKRMKDRGWQVLCCPRAMVLHHWGASSRMRGEWATLQLYRAKRQYFLKHYGSGTESLLRIGLVARIVAKWLCNIPKLIVAPQEWYSISRTVLILTRDLFQHCHLSER